MSIAEQIFERRAKSVKPEWLADLYGRLVWLLDDNGADTLETLRRWVESGDLERARVAVAFDEAFLYLTRDEMVAAFARLTARFPELRSRCDEIVSQWDQQHENL
jgi:hypothetical protein